MIIRVRLRDEGKTFNNEMQRFCDSTFSLPVVRKCANCTSLQTEFSKRHRKLEIEPVKIKRGHLMRS